METPSYKQATHRGFVYKIKREDSPDGKLNYSGAVYNHRNHVFYIRKHVSFRTIEKDFKKFIDSVYNRISDEE